MEEYEWREHRFDYEQYLPLAWVLSMNDSFEPMNAGLERNEETRSIFVAFDLWQEPKLDFSLV